MAAGFSFVTVLVIFFCEKSDGGVEVSVLQVLFPFCPLLPLLNASNSDWLPCWTNAKSTGKQRADLVDKCRANCSKCWNSMFE